MIDLLLPPTVQYVEKDWGLTLESNGVDSNPLFGIHQLRALGCYILSMPQCIHRQDKSSIYIIGLFRRLNQLIK